MRRFRSASAKAQQVYFFGVATFAAIGTYSALGCWAS
jgi:hypothetical protein